MRCSRVQFLYEDYTAGTLEAVTASRLDQHLASCAGCREYFEGNDEISELVSSTSDVVHPGDAYLEDLSSRVMESLYDDTGAFRPADTGRAESFESRSRINHRPLWWAGAVAALLLVAPMAASLIEGGKIDGKVGETSLPSAPQDLSSATTIAKSIQNGDFEGPADEHSELLASALPLGQGLIYKSIHPVSLSQHDIAVPTEEKNKTEDPSAVMGTIEELIALEAVGTPEARQRIYVLLRELGDQLNGKNPEIQKSNELVLMKQTHLYRQAEEAIKAAHDQEALDAYRRVLEISPSTILGRRASMRMADIFYYRLGDFDRALSSYRIAAGQNSHLAMSQKEVRHVARRIKELEAGRHEGYATLHRIFELTGTPWAEVPAKFGSLIGMPGAEDYSDDISTVLMNRLAASDVPSDEVAFELVDLIESSIGTLRAPESKSWLYLLLGDIIWVRFESTEPAMEAYESALKINDRSESAVMARQRISLLRDDKVVVFGR